MSQKLFILTCQCLSRKVISGREGPIHKIIMSNQKLQIDMLKALRKFHSKEALYIKQILLCTISLSKPKLLFRKNRVKVLVKLCIQATIINESLMPLGCSNKSISIYNFPGRFVYFVSIQFANIHPSIIQNLLH